MIMKDRNMETGRKENKEVYAEPRMELIYLQQEDIIITSGEDGGEDDWS